MADLVLVGGGGLCRELLGWFSPSVEAEGGRFIGYLDDGEHPLGAFGDHLPQLGRIHQDGEVRSDWRLVMAIADPAGKQAVAETLLRRGGVFETLIHPTTWRSATARVGQGTVIGPFCNISADTLLEDFVIFGGYASAGHDARVGAFSTLSNYVDITGGVQVGRGVFFGSGARVIPRVDVGDGCRIGAGAVVVRTVAPGSVLYTPPARRL
jgi:sugar O-acyltransferase (sialic acid O-acetyltransferase NeuD family)